MEWALAHEILTFIIILSVLWAVERMVRTFLNRNKPTVKCDCVECDCECCETDDDEDDEEDS